MGTPHILIVSGHPDLNHSIANATILDEVETALPDVEIRRLDRLYPHGNINISAEQESLLRADVIVWQFPFSWYGLPGLMKQWLDEVFVHGFARGSTAKLGGKKLLLSFTTGAPQTYDMKSMKWHPSPTMRPPPTSGSCSQMSLGMEPAFTR